MISLLAFCGNPIITPKIPATIFLMAGKYRRKIVSKPRGMRGKLTTEEEELLERLPTTPFLSKDVGENVYQVLKSLADRGIIVRVGISEHRIVWLRRFPPKPV